MNDEHFDQRASVIDSEMDVREGQMKELQTEKDSIVKQMEEKQSEEDQIKNELTELQAKIAQITGSVDEKKNHIMEILNNRASTKAQIQKFDTMMEQIQVRKSQINREILANDSEIAEENENLNKYQMELKVISDKIIALNNENKEYESNIKTLQAQISRESQKLQIGQSAFHREQSHTFPYSEQINIPDPIDTTPAQVKKERIFLKLGKAVNSSFVSPFGSVLRSIFSAILIFSLCVCSYFLLYYFMFDFYHYSVFRTYLTSTRLDAAASSFPSPSRIRLFAPLPTTSIAFVSSG